MKCKYHPKNERIKEAYYVYQREVEGRSESTIDGICKSICRFEDYTGYKDFATFRLEQAVAFKKHLQTVKRERTGDALSKATLIGTLRHLQDFFKWLAMQDVYRGKVKQADVAYFNPTTKDLRLAQSRKLPRYPTLEQIQAVVAAMSSDTDIQKRDRALIAFTILTGARDSAIISMKLKHLDTHNERITQYPDEVKTKRSKTIITGFFPIGEEFRAIVLEWAAFLTKEKLFGADDPLFPKTAIFPDEAKGFAVAGLSKEHWHTTSSVRNIFKHAFTTAGLNYFNPHSFRHTLGHLLPVYCKGDLEAMKCWSQNLGHESVNTTWQSYGTIDPHRQCEVVKALGHRTKANSLEDDIREIKSLLTASK